MLQNISFQIETFDTLPSTQDEMRARLERSENVHGLVIRGLEQTSGRGQRARDWQSSKGGSYQTLAVHDEHTTLGKPYAAIVIALGLAQTLPEYGIQVGIKWPNDLYYKDKKVAGILCEVVQRHLLIGVGVNVNNDVPEGAVALRGLDIEGVSNVVLAGVQRGLGLLQNTTDLPRLFSPYDVLKDKQVSVWLNGKEETGVAQGLHSNGCLLVEINTTLQQICQGVARIKR